MATRHEREARKGRERKRVPLKEWVKKQSGGESTAVKLPKGMTWYKPEVGIHLIDFMPYIAATGNPDADEGYECEGRSFYSHRVPTDSGKSKPYVCIGRGCPLCRYVQQNGEMAKDFKAKKRWLWIVNDKPGDNKNPLKLYETNDWNRGQGFWDLMQDAYAELPDGVFPSNLKDGMTAKLTVKELSFSDGASSRTYSAVTRISFVKRDYDYPDGMSEKCPCLDELLIIKTAEELESIISGSADADSHKGKKREHEEEDEDEDTDDENEDEEEGDTDEDEEDNLGNRRRGVNEDESTDDDDDDDTDSDDGDEDTDDAEEDAVDKEDVDDTDDEDEDEDDPPVKKTIKNPPLKKSRG